MILVDVVVPSVDETFDFMVDENQLVSSVTMDICDVISKYIKSEITGNSELFKLYRKDTQVLLNGNRTLYQQGIRDGSTLLLI